VQEGATYQWLYCDNGYEEIPEATEQTYFPVASGNYAVIIFDGICEDTSACVNATIVSTDEQDVDSGFIIYPNPAGNEWSIDMGQPYSLATVGIYDTYGRQLFYAPYRDIELIPMHLTLTSGIYTVIINSGHTASVLKLVKY
jgi:hypothetical protein